MTKNSISVVATRPTYDEFMDYCEILILNGKISSNNEDDVFWDMLGKEKPSVIAKIDGDYERLEMFLMGNI